MNLLALQLHQLFNAQKRFTFPFEVNKNEIPTNGIYIIFEKGEKFNDCDRIISSILSKKIRIEVFLEKI